MKVMMKKTDLLPINGIVLVNKPQGLSSHSTVKKVQYAFKAAKAGHTGSLDPLATGMLPICLGQATKFCSYLLNENKSYTATGMLGEKTATGDAWGETIARNTSFVIEKTQLQHALQQFIGPIQQIPPMYSALKHNGVPLYKLAREGKTIERQAREITIYALKLVRFEAPYFEIEISCSKGTYIRTLVEDIAHFLGLHAHLTALHRTYTAGFQHETMYSLEQVLQASENENMKRLLPVDRAVDYFPSLQLPLAAVNNLRQGKVITTASTTPIGVTRVYNEQDFIGLADISASGIVKAKKLLSF